MAKSAEHFTTRYAKGLMDALVQDPNDPTLDQILKELKQVGSWVNGEAEEFFANPTFTLEEKQNVLTGLLKEAKAHVALEQFFPLVLSLDHMSLTQDIAKAFEEELHERRNEVQGTVRTAYPLSKEEHANLASALEKATGKKVLLKIEEDKDLIGGVVAHVGSVVYDSSIQGFINRLQQEL